MKTKSGDKPHLFKKGRERHPKAGRAKGTPNKKTRILREAILEAAELYGKDGKGKEGLVGLLLRLIDKDIRSFASLLGRVLPLQVRIDATVEKREYKSIQEIRVELQARGVPISDGSIIQ